VVRDPNARLPYRAVWAIDFEFRHPDGHPLPEHVRCMVASDLKSGRELRLWADELPADPPFDVDRDLFVAFAADAEWSCFLKLGWRLPAHVIDLRYEYLALRNAVLRGRQDRRASLQDALRHYGLPTIAEKQTMRDLAMRAGASSGYTPREREDLLAYCAEDTLALQQLLPSMLLGVRLDEAVWRGRFSYAMATIESTGTPLDEEMARWISDNRDRIRRRAIAELDLWGFYRCQKAMLEDRRRERGHVVKRPHECSAACDQWFDTDAFVDWLEGLGIELERYRNTGNPILNKKTLEEYADMYSEVAPAISLRNALSDLHANKLIVGPDGRNRAWLAPFGSITGRCQPSNSEYIFGLSRFYRNLIVPPPGRAVIYLDFSQQEFLIAAVLSQDDEMFKAYMRGDTYIGVGEAWGLIKPDMAPEEVAEIRKLVKLAVLGIQYQMGVSKLARYIKRPRWQAAQYLLLHKDVFWKYWKWSDDFVNSAQLNGDAISGVNWDLIGHNEKEPTLRNYPIQSTGAEILRQTCCMVVEAGIQLCATIHDAILAECGVDEVDQIKDRVSRIMVEAARLVLNDGHMLQVGDLQTDMRVDAKAYAHPTRFDEGRDNDVWKLITRMREEDGYEPIQ
jgi:DNA polymerase-1